MLTPVSKALQSKSISIKEAEEHLQNAHECFQDTRNSFDDIMASSRELAENWGTEPSFEEKRSRKIKSHFDELSQDTRFTDEGSKFRINVFNRTLDILVNQIQRRFDSFKRVVSKFDVLCPKALTHCTDDGVYEKAKRLCHEYNDDLSTDLPQQMVSFKNTFKIQLNKLSSTTEAALQVCFSNLRCLRVSRKLEQHTSFSSHCQCHQHRANVHSQN